MRVSFITPTISSSGSIAQPRRFPLLSPLSVTLISLLLAACAPQAPRYGAGTPVAGGVPLTPEHTFSPGDQFELRFPFSAEFNDKATIGQDGHVSLKTVGDAILGGLTLPEATARLKALYAGKVKDTELSLTIRRYAPETIYVDGWVNRAGIVRSEVPLTLSRALTQAGGVKSGAEQDDILIIRRDDAGRLHTVSAALGFYAGAGRPDQDPMLKSFDIVYVPRTPIAAVADFLDQYARNVPFSASFRVSPTGAAPVIPQIAVPRSSVPQPVVTPP